MSAHWLLAVGFAGMAVAIFFLGWSARIMRVEWRDDRALRAAEARYERHTHRKGDPLPAALRPFPGEWRFAGESEQGWASESAEYELLTQTARECGTCHDTYVDLDAHELLHQTATLPASSVEGEPPIDTGEIQAITEWADALIAEMQAQGNVDRHTIQAGD